MDEHGNRWKKKINKEEKHILSKVCVYKHMHMQNICVQERNKESKAFIILKSVTSTNK